MMRERLLLLGLCALIMVAAQGAVAQGVFNPSFEAGLDGWFTYTYFPSASGHPGNPDAGCIGSNCKFDVLYPQSVPHGANVCGMQAWGDTINGGVRQDFTWDGGPATLSVKARAYSVKFDFTEYDNGCRVRMGLFNGVIEDRELVTNWITFPWGDAWYERKFSIPGPGLYTLFIESYQPNSDAIMSTLWDNIVITPLPPVLLTSGPTVSVGDPQNPDTTIRISWTTNVPSTSRVEYGLTQSLGQSTEDTELVTQHSVLLTGLQHSSTYYFRIVSDAPDYASWISDVDTFSTPIQFSDVVTSLTPDGVGTKISWKTDVPTTTQVEYGPSTDYGNLTEEDLTLKTDHEVVLTDLPEDTVIHFRLHARNQPLYNDAVSADCTFLTLPVVSDQIRNAGFEDMQLGSHSLYPWVQYVSMVQSSGYHPIDGLIGPFAAGGSQYWFNGIQAYDGSYFLGAAANSDYKNGGVFQRVRFTPGELCTLTAHFATYRAGGADGYTRVRLGIDPNGGVNPEGPGIKWWSGFSSTNDNQWHAAAVTATAGPGGVVTLFLDIQQSYPLLWHICAIDGVTFGPPTQMSIGQLKDADDSLSAILSNKIVTHVARGQISYQGVSYRKVYIQEDDRSAGIAVLLDQSKGAIPEVGNRLTVVGSLSIRDNEAMLTAESWSVDSTQYALPEPVAVVQRSIGGSTRNQPALNSSVGLCNVGLRVKTFGRVTWADPEGYPGYEVEAYIDDGSQYIDASEFGGLKVWLEPNFDAEVYIGDYLSVTGVLTVQYYDPDGWPNGNEYHTYRVVTNSGDDWSVLPAAQ